MSCIQYVSAEEFKNKKQYPFGNKYSCLVKNVLKFVKTCINGCDSSCHSNSISHECGQFNWNPFPYWKLANSFSFPATSYHHTFNSTRSTSEVFGMTERIWMNSCLSSSQHSFSWACFDILNPQHPYCLLRPPRHMSSTLHWLWE